MKILYITQLLPYPKNSGGKIKTFETIKALGKENQIFLVGFISHRKDIKNISFLKKYCHKIRLFFNPNVEARFNKILNVMIRSLFSHLPFEVYRYYDKRLDDYVEKITLEEKFGAVHIDHINMAQYFPEEKSSLWVLEEHNIESASAFEIFKIEKSIIYKLFYLLEAIKFFFFERHILNKFDIIFAISPVDKLRLLAKKVRGRVEVLPTPIKVKKVYKKKRSSKNIISIGSLLWWPNKDGLIWFYKKMWRRVKLKIPEVKLIVVGELPAANVKKVFNKKDVDFIGYVNNPDEHLSEASLMILPLRIGGGVKIKMLTGLSRGVPVVATRKAAQGIKIRHKKEAMLADSVDEFVRYVCEILNDNQLAKRLSDNGIKLIRESYSTKELKRALKLVYRN